MYYGIFFVSTFKVFRSINDEIVEHSLWCFNAVCVQTFSSHATPVTKHKD